MNNDLTNRIVNHIRINDGITEYRLCQELGCFKDEPRRLVAKGLIISEKVKTRKGEPGHNGRYGYKFVYHLPPEGAVTP